jgi:hypothetical protein
LEIRDDLKSHPLYIELDKVCQGGAYNLGDTSDHKAAVEFVL